MELQLVSFEQAKALKELGFYCYCDNDSELYVTSNETTWEQAIEIPYSDNYDYITHHETFPVDVTGQLLRDVRKNNICWNTKFQTVYAPTLELAAKWLREKKGIHIIPDISNQSYKYFYVVKQSNKQPIGNHGFNSWEEALSAGIDQAIEILKDNEKSIV